MRQVADKLVGAVLGAGVIWLVWALGVRLPQKNAGLPAEPLPIWVPIAGTCFVGLLFAVAAWSARRRRALDARADDAR